MSGEIDPNSAEMYRLLGRTYNGQRKIDEAIDAYRQAIAMDAEGRMVDEQPRVDVARTRAV